MLPRAWLALLLAAAATGCAAEAEPSLENAALARPPQARAMDWANGNWWAYHASLEGSELDIALIVHSSGAETFQLGTNLSAGFFGLPWSGNVSSDLNPRIGAEEWRLFDLPLHDGKSWTHTILGHQAKTTARAAMIDVRGVDDVAGFRLESTSYGQIFARYDFVPEVGWFTSLQLIEPTDGHLVLDAKLTAFGPDWGAAYFVEETIRELRLDYPALPDAITVTIPEGYMQVRATIIAQTATGLVSADLRDEHGRILTSARVMARGVDTGHATARPTGGAEWTLEHRGLGTGSVRLDITGVSPSGPLS